MCTCLLTFILVHLLYIYICIDIHMDTYLFIYSLAYLSICYKYIYIYIHNVHAMFEVVMYFLPFPSFCLAMLAWQQIFVHTLHPAFRTNKQPPKQTNKQTNKRRNKRNTEHKETKKKETNKQPTNQPNKVSKLYITVFFEYGSCPNNGGGGAFWKVGAFFKAQIQHQKKKTTTVWVPKPDANQKIRIHVFDLKSSVQTKKK